MKRVAAIIGLVACVALLAGACIPYGTTTVATADLLTQSSSTTGVTLYTPPDDGEYLATMYGTCTAGAGGGIGAFFTWTDENRTYTDDLGISFGAGGFAQGQYILHLKGGQPLIYDSFWGGSGATCDLFIRLVKL